MQRKILTYGVIAGTLMVAFFMAAFGSGMDSSLSYSQAEMLGYAGMVLAMSMLVIAMVHYNKTVGPVTFGTGVKLGGSVALVAAVIFGIFTFVLYEYIAPDMGARLMEKAVQESAAKGNMSTEQIEAMKAQYETMSQGIYGQGWFQGLIMLVTILLVSAPITLISSAVFHFINKK